VKKLIEKKKVMAKPIKETPVKKINSGI